MTKRSQKARVGMGLVSCVSFYSSFPFPAEVSWALSGREDSHLLSMHLRRLQGTQNTGDLCFFSLFPQGRGQQGQQGTRNAAYSVFFSSLKAWSDRRGPCIYVAGGEPNARHTVILLPQSRERANERARPPSGGGGIFLVSVRLCGAHSWAGQVKLG